MNNDQARWVCCAESIVALHTSWPILAGAPSRREALQVLCDRLTWTFPTFQPLRSWSESLVHRWMTTAAPLERPLSAPAIRLRARLALLSLVSNPVEKPLKTRHPPNPSSPRLSERNSSSDSTLPIRSYNKIDAPHFRASRLHSARAPQPFSRLRLVFRSASLVWRSLVTHNAQITTELHTYF
jgi:hypothetical protein